MPTHPQSCPSRLAGVRLLLLDIAGKRPLPSNPLVTSVRGRRKVWSRRGLVCHSLCATEAGGGFTTLAQRFEECRWRVVDGLERGLHAQRNFLTGTQRFCGASTSLSPLPLENTGLSIVPLIRKGNCNLPSFKVAPDSRAMVLVKKLSLVVISASPR